MLETNAPISERWEYSIALSCLAWSRMNVSFALHVQLEEVTLFSLLQGSVQWVWYRGRGRCWDCILRLLRVTWSLVAAVWRYIANCYRQPSPVILWASDGSVIQNGGGAAWHFSKVQSRLTKTKTQEHDGGRSTGEIKRKAMSGDLGTTHNG